MIWNVFWIFATLFTATNAYRVDNGILFDNNGHVMRISGVSWFGSETPDMTPNGMWVHNMTFYMDLMAAQNFNVIRIPFSSELVLYHWDDYPSPGFVSASPDQQHKKAIEILDDVFDHAHARNMLILLDLHRLNDQYISELHYDPNDGRFTSATFIETWFKMLDRYHQHPALWGVDLLNEPHGRATVNDGNPNTDWKMFAEYAIHQIEERFPEASWIYLIEGVEWGKQLSGFAQNFIEAPAKAQHRVAYSAHNYGRSVVPTTNVWDVNGLYQDWDSHFGFIWKKGQAVIIGEWGGKTEIDAGWMDTFVGYLKERNMTDTFFWALNENSGDVAGFLQSDWTTIDNFKRGVVQKLQPSPHPVPHAVLP